LQVYELESEQTRLALNPTSIYSEHKLEAIKYDISSDAQTLAIETKFRDRERPDDPDVDSVDQSMVILTRLP